MSQPLNVAVVGATGSVGEALVGLLDERDFPLHRLHLLASAESAGQRMGFAESSLRVGDVDSFDFSSVGLAFFAAAAEVSRAHAELFGDRPERRPGTERRTAGHGFGECRTPGLASGAVPFVQSLRRSRRTVRSAGATPGHAGLPATEPDSLPLRLQPGARRGQGTRPADRRTAQCAPPGAASLRPPDRLQPARAGRRGGCRGTQRDRAAHLRGGAGLAWRAYRTVERYLHPGAGILRR